MNEPSLGRREFLNRVSLGLAAGAAGVVGAWPRVSLASVRKAAPNDRIGWGLIGCGSLGVNHHLRHILTRPEFEVLAVCDVDRQHLGQAVELTGGQASGYADFRALLDRQDIDAVMVVTPDHWHGLAAIQACQAGKDVYCEKPLSLTVRQGRAMVEAARRYDRVFQTGSQQRSSHQFWWACDLVRNGRIGKLQRITASIGRGPTCEFEPNLSPPAHLDWNAWLGPAPEMPYTPKRCHYTFRWLYDTSGGKMTDWGAHHLDIAQWANGSSLSGPVEAEGEGEFPAAGIYDTAISFNVRYRYENGVELIATSEGENGVTLEGTEGQIFVSRSRISADPVEILETEPDSGEVRLYHSTQHHTDWVQSMRNRTRPICDVEIGHRSATVCHLGNIALRLGRKIHWDPQSETVVGDEEASRMLMRPLRSPFTL